MDLQQSEAATLGVPMKKRSESMQQIYRRTPMPKCISIKLLCSSIEITLRHGCSPMDLLHIFRTAFLKKTSGWLLLSSFKISYYHLWKYLQACVSDKEKEILTIKIQGKMIKILS